MTANIVETYADNLQYLNQANMRYLNPSLIFFGKISMLNTTGFRTEEETAEEFEQYHVKNMRIQYKI